MLRSWCYAAKPRTLVQSGASVVEAKCHRLETHRAVPRGDMVSIRIGTSHGGVRPCPVTPAQALRALQTLTVSDVLDDWTRWDGVNGDNPLRTRLAESPGLENASVSDNTYLVLLFC